MDNTFADRLKQVQESFTDKDVRISDNKMRNIRTRCREVKPTEGEHVDFICANGVRYGFYLNSEAEITETICSGRAASWLRTIRTIELI